MGFSAMIMILIFNKRIECVVIFNQIVALIVSVTRYC